MHNFFFFFCLKCLLFMLISDKNAFHSSFHSLSSIVIHRKWPHLWVNKPSTIFFYWSASSSVIFNGAINRLSKLSVLSIWFAGSLVKCTARGWQMNVHMNFNSTNCWENILILDYNNDFRLSWDCFLIISSFISHKSVHSLGREFYETSLWSHNKSLIN